jgi:hypothetical protein
MIVAGGKELISLQMLSIVLLLAATAVAIVIYARVRWLRRTTGEVRRSVDTAPVGIEISHAEFVAMKDDMELGPTGDGRDAAGRYFAIYRYQSRQTGQLYDYITGVGEPRVIQYPAPSGSSVGALRSAKTP